MSQQKQYISALDIGTSKVVALIGEVMDGQVHIIGMGQASSRGLKSGMVTNIDATAQAIRHAVKEAELMADCEVGSVVTGITGNHIRSLNSQGVVKIKDGEVNQADIDRAKEAAKTINIPPDHQILHTVVQEYIIDGQPGVREPLGMSGIRLDTRVHITTGALTALQNVQKCVERCQLGVTGIMLQPLASADSVLTEDEKELGVCVIDIGAGTTDIAVYTNGAIRHTAVIPVAGDLITRDLAQALRTPYDAAEHIKIYHGVALPDLEGLDEMVEVPSVGDKGLRQVSRHTLAHVIGPRMEEILEFVRNELRMAKISEDSLISGIILTGGGAMLTGIAELAEDIFRLPVRIGVPHELNGLTGQSLRHPRYAAVIGLLEHAKNSENRSVSVRRHQNSRQEQSSDAQEKQPGIFTQFGKKLNSWWSKL